MNNLNNFNVEILFNINNENSPKVYLEVNNPKIKGQLKKLIDQIPEGFRLPTKEELVQIYYFLKENKPNILNNLPPKYIWSGTPYGYGGNHYVVSFVDGFEKQLDVNSILPILFVKEIEQPEEFKPKKTK